MHPDERESNSFAGTQFTLPMTSIAAGVALFGLFRPRRAKKALDLQKAGVAAFGLVDRSESHAKPNRLKWAEH